MATKIIITIICLLLFFAVIGAIVVFMIKKTDPNNKPSTTKSNVPSNSTQSEMLFEDIKDKMIHLGHNQYRVILECSSVNYQLKSEAEMDLIECSFQQFINSVSHPLSIFVQTRDIDNTKMMQTLTDTVSESASKYESLTQYGNYYLNEMSNLYDTIGNSKERKKYIIIPYDEVGELTNLTQEEKYEQVLDEMSRRITSVSAGLQAVGISVDLLDTTGLIDLLYSYYHKTETNQSENIKAFTSAIVNGNDRLCDLSSEQILDRILAETEAKLELEIIKNPNAEIDYAGIATQCREMIGDIRKNMAGFYKDNSVYNITFGL